MIVTHVKITYLCKNCAVPYTFKFGLKTAADPTIVAKHMSKTRECAICKRAMHIKYVSFRVLNVDDEYGSNTVGSWRCPHHGSFVYYPDMMRQANNGVLKIVSTGHLLYHRYLKLVSMQYPWKCPVCSELLQYTEARYCYVN